MAYKGMMLSDVPNFAFAIGYTNASWTLKVDLCSEYVCRLLNHMERTGTKICTPHNDDPSVTEEPLIDFQAGYVLRSLEQLPKQGSKSPWKLAQNYPRDLVALRFGSVEDDGMRFSNPVPPRRASPSPPSPVRRSRARGACGPWRGVASALPGSRSAGR